MEIRCGAAASHRFRGKGRPLTGLWGYCGCGARVEGAAGDVGGQVFAAGLVDEVRVDVVPVVFGAGRRYFGSVHAQRLLEDPDILIRGDRVLHLRYRVRR
jgi:hypothetical protein